MNSCIKRIEHLANMLGLDGERGSSYYAELCGYAAGIELVNAYIKEQSRLLNPNFASGRALDLYSNMLGIPSELAENEKRAQIINRLGSVFGDNSYGNVVEAVSEYNDECEVSNGVVSITINPNDTGLLRALGKIVENYVSPTSMVSINNSDYDFDAWDGMDYTFNAYDSLKLAFYILDQF